MRGHMPERDTGVSMPEIDQEWIIRCIGFLLLNCSDIWERMCCWTAVLVFYSFALFLHF